MEHPDMTKTHPWHEFDISGPTGASIPLHQIEENKFDLGDVTITYHGVTGLEHHIPDRISALEHELLRTITPEHLPSTDLASVPGPLRWFTNTYGAHTPAALIHDYLIVDKGDAEIVPAVWADRYFRFMLRSCGVPFFKRSIMWTGVPGLHCALGGTHRRSTNEYCSWFGPSLRSLAWGVSLKLHRRQCSIRRACSAPQLHRCSLPRPWRRLP